MNYRGFLLIFLVALCGQSYSQKKGSHNLHVDKNAVNFILMGDWGRNGEDHQKEVADQMGKIASRAGVDFIISAGDNFYPRGVASEFDPLWKYSFEDIYTDFSLQWDWHPVLGNHDYGADPEAQVKYTRISRRWKMPARYYSKTFETGDGSAKLLIAFVDTCPLIPSYYGTAHAVQDQDSTAQKVWFEKLFQDNKDVKWKLVVGHHPMFTGGGRENDENTLAIRGSLLPLMEKYGVHAYLSGHEHSLQHIGPIKGVHQFISGSASERTPARLLKDSKFAASEYGFMLFTIGDQYMLVQVIDYNGKVLYSTKIQ